MPDLIYESPRPHSHDEANAAFESGDIGSICQVMIGLAFHDPDWRWVQDHCICLSSHEESQLRYISAICILHLARIHRKLDLDKVKPMLLSLANDADTKVRGAAEDAIEDLMTFMKVNVRTK